MCACVRACLFVCGCLCVDVCVNRVSIVDLISRQSARVEATSAFNGIGVVKLMGREAGFIAAHAALASGDVDLCLIPEVPPRRITRACCCDGAVFVCNCGRMCFVLLHIRGRACVHRGSSVFVVLVWTCPSIGCWTLAGQIPVVLDGPSGVLDHLQRTISTKGSAVVVVGEGAGVDILPRTWTWVCGTWAV